MTEVATSPLHRRSDWLGGLFAALVVGVFAAAWFFDQSFTLFLVTMAVDALMTLAFLVWWITRGSLTWGQRFLVLICAVGFGIAVGGLTRRTIGMPIIIGTAGLPFLFALWWLAFMATRSAPRPTRVAVLIACVALVWSPFLLLRMTSFNGNLRADLHWRWTPTPEQLYLAEHSNSSPTPATQPVAKTLELKPGDWPAFRGPRRDSIARGLKIATDWNASPPKLLWKERVGPAWSSMAVVDGVVFTQEQRGDHEAVVARDAGTGAEIWAHDDPGRFEEPMSGIGPRATPAFDHGHIYAQAALGTLNCLDASTGHLLWKRDVQKDTDAVFPMWGFCASPLATDDRVIVFASGEGKKGLIAYAASDGHVLWTADTGKMSYSSPQWLDTPAGKSVLFFANEGFYCVDPADGKIRWQLPFSQKVGLPAALQACLISPTALVLGNGALFGAQRLDLANPDSAPSQKWVTPRVKPGFSDMVFYQGNVYGFDGTTFCCFDANTGQRRWRQGSYGAGQVLLIEDSGVLLVSTEDGQAVLLKCNPDRSEELGRFQALTGKSWNHQAIAQGRLYLRSDAELACYDLHPQ